MTTPAKKPWLESDERKKALESIPEAARESADEYDREQTAKQTMDEARRKHSEPEKKKSGWGSGS